MSVSDEAEARTILQAHDLELMNLLQQGQNALANGNVDDVLRERLEHRIKLAALLHQQTRWMKFQLGIPVEPEAHEIAVVLQGIGEGGMA